MTETTIFCLYGLLEWRKKPASADPPAPPVSSPGAPVHKENIEELTDSIRHTARILNKVFRV